ncbi:MAG: poly-gamma-glutamate biosynthesis protein PgsC [Oscillospiraceae bacterium]|nr:poly-gamma-glutamate biosynthesis protein PgsC [Oscillospiraceae bacterium]
MEVTYLYVALIVGMAISLLMAEFFGVNPGGMIVPGYLALICDNIPQMLIIFGVSIAVYLIVNYVLPKFVILFGRRKFVATLIVGIIIKLILELLFPFLPFATLEFRGIGVITPSLIASCYSKQGFKYTIPSVLIATYLTFAIVTLLFWVL